MTDRLNLRRESMIRRDGTAVVISIEMSSEYAAEILREDLLMRLDRGERIVLTLPRRRQTT